ncbi:hypothetical protein [Natronococcus jeotgali]|uniref:hypothetical protein n=1 Tax=Natronococcus jeotgali TaxID=413812 RepID=UPI000677BAFC|nr:hypothetical protein [Natronococcus jeotgali]
MYAAEVPRHVPNSTTLGEWYCVSSAVSNVPYLDGQCGNSETVTVLERPSYTSSVTPSSLGP